MINYQTYYGENFTDRERAWRELAAGFKAENIVNMCHSIPHKHIIDVGAGNGAVSYGLSTREFAASIVCLDVSGTGVEEIIKREIPAVTAAKQFDGYHIPYSDGSFDLAVCSHVLEHVEHERQFIHELLRVAKYLFIEVPLEDILRGPLDYAEQQALYVDHMVGHINFYNYKTLRRLMQTCDAEVIDQRLFLSPFALHKFRGGIRDYAEFGIRRIGDIVSKRLSARFFSHHCGILVTRKPA